jgi:hypothetical protein
MLGPVPVPVARRPSDSREEQRRHLGSRYLHPRFGLLKPLAQRRVPPPSVFPGHGDEFPERQKRAKLWQ